MKTNNKTFSQRIWFGIKSGWDMPILPDHIIKLERENIYIKILRIIGPLSIFIIIIGLGKQFNPIIYYINFMVSFIYIIYKNIIAYYAVKQWFHSLITGKFIVRNSPLDLFVSLLKGSVAGIKTVGKFTIGTGMTYALCHELDDRLVENGKSPYFIPKLKNAIHQTGLDNAMDTFLTSMGITDMVQPVSSIYKKFLELNDVEKTEFETNTGVSYKDGLKIMDYLEKKNNGSEISQAVQELLDKIDPFDNKKK